MFNGSRLPSEHHVLGHDGDALCVNGTQVGVLKQSNEVSFRSLLEGKYSCALEMTVRLELLSNLSYQTLEWRGRQRKCPALMMMQQEATRIRPIITLAVIINDVRREDQS
jgi:hypothetical protein